ncbi:hypothetical protein [Streptomyces megasporus]|uniref:hypothetical protein n=1 Tax=Streptomyces megasporus TaxID=44060 RepID=UPI00068FED67|nr:hypothetical protein [Streptomyces megasporus]
MSALDHSPREPDQLRDQVNRLLRHRAAIASGLLLGTLAGGAVAALGGDDYTATGEVVVQPVGTASPESGSSADRRISMGTERRIALGAAVADRAAEALGGGTAPADLRRDLRVTNPPETHVLEFEYTADSPELAARGVDAFVRAYLDHRRDTADRRIDATVEKLTGELEPLLERRGELDRRIAAGGPDASAAESEREGLTARTADLQGRIAALKALDTTPGEVVREGEPPDAPSGPGAAVLLAAGAVVGSAGGLVAAWVRSLLDPRVRSADEVRALLRAPVLAGLPRRRAGGGARGIGLEVGPSHEGERAETYRTLARRILGHERFAEPGGLLVASPGEPDAAAAVAVNLAAALAETGRDVLLVEIDPRAPRLAGALPLRGASPAEWPGRARLTVDAGTAGSLELLPGDRFPDVPRALNSPEIARLLSGGTGRDEYVVAVTRPLLSHADGTAVAPLVGGVVVVCDPDATRGEELERVRELVPAVGGHLLGAVLHHGARRDRRSRRAPDGAPPDSPRPKTPPTAPPPAGGRGPEPSEIRQDTAYGSYGRYRRTGDGTTSRT